jgi:hypothetical protein
MASINFLITQPTRMTSLFKDKYQEYQKMSDKFEKKYKTYLHDRAALAEKRVALTATVDQLIDQVVQQPFKVISSWINVLDDLGFIEAYIEKHSIIEVAAIQSILQKCSPRTIATLNNGEGFDNIETFLIHIGELNKEYTGKLEPIYKNKLIVRTMAEINWLGMRETLCKINANGLSGACFSEPIDKFKSNWFMKGGKKL